MKTIEFTRRSMPTAPAIGYGDTVKVYSDLDVVYEGAASTCPNPFRPTDFLPWNDVYAMVSLGTYEGRVMLHDRFGKCILLEQGGPLPTVNENKKHGGKRIAMEIFIHVGCKGSKDPGWRGSMGCLTIPPKDNQVFFGLFNLNEPVAVVITTEDRSA